MKRKIFALLLVVLMLVPMVVACGGNGSSDTNTATPTQTQTQTNTETKTETNTESNVESDTTTSTESDVDSETTTNTGSTVVEKVDVTTADAMAYAKQKWDGKTLDVLATLWYGAGSKPEDAGTWSQPELYVKNYFDDTKYGQKINDAVMDRQNLIKDKYGVTLKWYVTSSNAVMNNEMQSGLEAGYAKYHVALPRMFNAQSLLGAETVYDLANSKYIDLTKSYYNQSSVDSFSIYGHTFFVAGDFSFVDEETATVIFYNQAISESIKTFPNLYNKVRNGDWTIAELAKWAKLPGISGDTDNESGYQDTDKYGFGSTGLSGFFQSSGIQQVGIQTSSTGERSYYIALNANNAAVNDLITQLSEIKSSTWARTEWTGGYGALGQAFVDGRLLFYHEVVQKFSGFPVQTDNFKVGVLPMPKLNTDQENYYAPLCSQSTVMCIPKCTLDREMSEFFFEVITATGQEYVMAKYHETLSGYLYDDGKTSRADALEMLTDYVFPGMSYDQGFMYDAMGQKFMSTVQSETINSTSGSSQFMTLYQEAFAEADKKLNDPKTGWNTLAKNYKD
jgi:hypothetical protein